MKTARHLALAVSLASAGAVGACQTSESAEGAAPVAAPSATVQRVRVTIDGVPAFGASVSQGGAERKVTTNGQGDAEVPLDPSVPGERWIVASFPTARARGVRVDPSTRLELELHAYADVDDPAYRFGPPGRAGVAGTAAECAHCHGAISAGFEESAHSTSASNPRVHDLYAGTAAARDTDDACADVGGTRVPGRTPGADGLTPRCYVGDSALARANPSCAAPPCDVTATKFAGCADCHAPAIDGALGGRDLLEARDAAFDGGVHCDLCHKVESIRDLGAPGVAGKLRVLRPSEPGPGPSGRLPITFGPYGDVGLPRMGSVGRTIFKDGQLCTGCHELSVTVAPSVRAPDGVLAVDSTSTEWAEGPMAGVPCQSCHGGRLDVANAAGGEHHDPNADLASGWPRPPGAVHDHKFCGPRGERDLAALALTLELSTRVVGATLEVDATLTNRGAGHALPSGESMRALLLLVEATCDGVALAPTGGDVVPELGGAYARKVAGEDWSRWPGARIGQQLRVVTRSGAPRDYDGPGRFAKGALPASEKGLPEEALAGVRTITAVAPDGAVTLDAALPKGDVIVLADAPGSTPDGRAARLAFTPGFAFARALVDASGRVQAPHFMATDVLFDDRLMPGRAAVTHHAFASTCEKPKVTARIVHRAFPPWLSDERGWAPRDRVEVEVTR